MKLITLLILSSISFNLFAQSSEAPDKIIENEFIKIQKQTGASNEKANENLSKFKNHKDENINTKNNRLSDVEVISHQLYIGIINGAEEFNEKTIPVDVMKTIGNVCLSHSHKNVSVAKSCSSEQLKNLVNAYKVIIDDEDKGESNWRSEFNSFVDLINACHANEVELINAARSYGADGEDDRLGEENKDIDSDALYNEGRYKKNGKIKKKVIDQ